MAIKKNKKQDYEEKYKEVIISIRDMGTGLIQTYSLDFLQNLLRNLIQ